MKYQPSGFYSQGIVPQMWVEGDCGAPVGAEHCSRPTGHDGPHHVYRTMTHLDVSAPIGKVPTYDPVAWQRLRDQHPKPPRLRDRQWVQDVALFAGLFTLSFVVVYVAVRMAQ